MKTDKDQKKTIILGAMVLVLMSIGAFQMFGNSAPAPAKRESKKSLSAADKEQRAEDKKRPGFSNSLPQDLRDLVAVELPTRDPFLKLVETAADASTKKAAADAQAAKDASANGSGKPTPAGPASGDGTPDFPRIPGRSSIARPMNPMPGGLPMVDPSGGPTPVGQNNPGKNVEKENGNKLEPGKVLRNPGEAPFTVIGVSVGANSVAVLQSDSGEQRVVKEGSILDGNRRVVKISRGKVVVINDNKTQTLTLGDKK